MLFVDGVGDLHHAFIEPTVTLFAAAHDQVRDAPRVERIEDAPWLTRDLDSQLAHEAEPRAIDLRAVRMVELRAVLLEKCNRCCDLDALWASKPPKPANSSLTSTSQAITPKLC